MPQFRYLAKNMEGKNLRGTMDAAGESALQQQLKEQGLFLVQAKDVTASKSARKFSSKLSRPALTQLGVDCCWGCNCL